MKFTKFMEALEGAALSIGQVFRTNLPSYYDIETSDDEHTLISTSGAYVSGVRLYGCGIAVGPAEFVDISNNIAACLKPILKHQGHSVDFCISVDPDGAARDITDHARKLRAKSESLGLDFADMIEADRQAMKALAVKEEVFLAVWTRRERLQEDEINDGYKVLTELAGQVPPMGRNTQDPITGIDALKVRHLAVVQTLIKQLQQQKIMAEIMTAHEMCFTTREALYQERTPPNWKPLLPGDGIPLVSGPGILRRPESSEIDFSDLQAPSLASQVFEGDAERASRNSVRVGSRLFAPLTVEVPPREVVPFDVLQELLYDAKIPWRAMFRLDGGGLKFLMVRQQLASTLAAISKRNQRIAASFDDLEAADMDGEPAVRMRIAFSTWAPENKPQLLKSRLARLSTCITGWGGCEPREKLGDVMSALMSTIPFASEHHAGNDGACHLKDLVRFLPLFRPASPWRKGSQLFRTIDGKLIPWEAGSSVQTTWVYALTGNPGSGKSVQLNNIIRCVLLSPGAKRLPRAAFLDIGPSAANFAESVQGSLPRAMRHQVKAYKWSMTDDYGVNMFDLPLGCRYPTAEHKSKLVSYLTCLVTPAERAEPYERMSEMASAVIDDLYGRFDDHNGGRGKPKPYSKGAEREVDDLLAQYDLMPKPGEFVTWFNVTDDLFRRGHTREASLAQRRAVPTLEDCSNVSKEIAATYATIMTAVGQSMSDAFRSLIQAACRDYPNLARPTRFDIGEARIVAVDLSEVAKGDSPAARKQTNVMTQVAMYATTWDYRLIDETVDSMVMPPMYRDFHLQRAREINEDLKWIIMDEFRRYTNSPQTMDEVEREAREGRKFGVGLILASQAPTDLPERIRAFVTGWFICDHGSNENLEHLRKILDLNETTADLLKEHVNGPRSTGAPFLAHFKTKFGTFTNVLVSTLGNVTLWGLTTTAEDAVVRRAVCSQLGAQRGRKALASAYPSGGVKDVIEALKDAGEPEPYKKVVSEVLSRFERMELHTG